MHKISRVVILFFVLAHSAFSQNYTIQTFAGGGVPKAPGDVGDNGPATSAVLLNPTSMAMGPAGEIYIVDSDHNRLRKVIDGVITTVAGTGAQGFSGDGGPAIGAQLNRPNGVAVDAVGNVYISDTYNVVIRKIDKAGIISTVAGGNPLACGNPSGSLGDGGPATSACLAGPEGIVLDTAGGLYLADGSNKIRKVSNGMITTVAGNGVLTCGFFSCTTYSGDNGPATSAQLDIPKGVAVDASGNLYIADWGNSRVRMVSGGVITTVAGNPFGAICDNCPATSSQLVADGVAVDATGNLFIASSGNLTDNRVRKVANGVITTVAGSFYTNGGYSGDNGPAVNAKLNGPVSVAADALGRIFVADSGNNVIRVLTPPCSFALTSSSIQATPSGGFYNIGVQTPAYCSWSVSGLPDWVTGTIPVSVTGPSTITLVVAPDSSASRSAIITVAGIPVNVSQVVCTYAINPGGQAFTTFGGVGMVTVTAPPGCAWSATNTIPFVSFSGPLNGSGPGAVNFQVSANGGGDRSGTLTVAGLSFTVEQQSPTLTGLNFIGSMPHLAGEENWTTAFTLVNKSGASAQARMSLFGDALDPGGNGPLLLPLVFPQQAAAAQQAAASGTLLAASFDRTLGANASLIVNTAGPQTPPVLVGSAQLAATGPVDGFAIFHQNMTQQEAVVPLETRNASSYLLAFDNTKGLVLGIAVENVSSQNTVIGVVIRDDTGTVISAPGASISVGGNGHMAFVLSDSALGFPVTANKRGTVEFDTPAGGQISVLGLRFTPPNNALTTIPALANVGTGGGSIAHLALGGDGWQTTFVLVNTGTSSAHATLNFYADQTGASMLLPLTFPQGNIPDATASSVTQILLPGASLLVVSSGAANLLTGSAQLSTNGNVSGFVIFRHNGQEAVVPLEDRKANAYIIPFDNTNGTATGVAVNAVSAQAVNIPVTVRDDTGATIATDTIAMAANGHYAFTLGIDRYPSALTIRGTIEFDTPAGAQIGALGIRIPNVPAHTYTTLPALAK